MAAKKSGLGKGLGRGLDALIPEETAEKKTAAPAKAGEENEQGTMVKITKVEPNKEQPRKNFDEDALEEVAEMKAAYMSLKKMPADSVCQYSRSAHRTERSCRQKRSG